MSAYDAIAIVLGAILFRPVGALVHGHAGLPLLFHDTSDIYGQRLAARLSRLDRYLGSRWVLPLSIMGALLMGSRFTGWQAVDASSCVYPIILLISGLMTWKAVTLDIDLASAEPLAGPRLLMLSAAVLTAFHPAGVVAVLFIGINYLRSWYHHQHIPIRALIMFLAVLAGEIALRMLDRYLGLPGFALTSAAPLLALLCMIASHYVTAGVAKARLGPRPWSWIRRNRLHYLVVSAYLWGWLRKRPERQVISLASRIARLNIPVQAFVVVLELSGIGVGFHRWWAVAFFTGAALFHAGVFVLSGILFWQLGATCALLAITLATLPPAIADAWFGALPGLLVAGLIALFPLRGLGWKPQGLAWWDSPYIARIQWRVVGASGTVFALRNDFMCPNERLYGKGDFRGEPVLNGHLGETFDLDLRDRLVASRGNREILDRLKKCYSRSSRLGPEQLKALDDYQARFLAGFNAGLRKRVCPRWLKAPGGLYFYWSPEPEFRGQERVTRLLVVQTEEIFDGESIIVLRDEVLREIALAGGLAHSPAEPVRLDRCVGTRVE